SGYVVLGAEDPDPWLLVTSAYQAVWCRNETTTRRDRVESPSDVIARAGELTRKYVGRSDAVATVNVARLMSVGEHARFRDAFSGLHVIDATESFDALRRIKTPFEIAALRDHGSVLDASLDVFRDCAHPGMRYWEACARTEAFVKAKGSFWGRTKIALDLTPYTVPAPRDRIMREEDVINFEIVYESPWGYWLELTTVFSFHELPDDAQCLLQGYLLAAEAAVAAARSGNRFADVKQATESTLRSLGLPVAGTHTPDCHSIGLDGSDGPSSEEAPDFELVNGTVLSLHPGAVLERDRGMLISDNFLVTPEGAERLSPHDAERYHIEIDRSGRP
ncbi:MAG: M24 family metallopeptidase, partial [Gemmatimonadaceae bacterium]|nr:M24 family metallopeptidase [Trueperaceae bacterium]MBA3891528.1 M24 family metallopeptidase [Gemmatimonadaceae bacterium]